MDLHLLNKRVVITGSSGGIGKAIAKGFLEEGASVIIVARDQDKLSKTAAELSKAYGDDKVFFAICDCSKEESVQQLRGFVRKTWNGVDIVVANVGSGRSVPDAIPSTAQWSRVWSSNFDSALHTARIFTPMLEESRGSLLFISSIAGLEAFGAPVDYSTAKAAIIAFAKNMSRKLAHIRVNVVAPGNVYFEGGSWDEKIKQDKDRVDSLIRSTVPVNRFASPEEISDAVVFLCSDRANFITGATLVVDGGQTVGVY